MPESRTDWLTGRSVIVAENRAGRPNEFALAMGEPSTSAPPGGTATPAFSCPFCPGHESATPPAVYEPRDSDGRWRLRVIPNRYPAFMLDTKLPLAEGEGPGDGSPIADAAISPAVGAHEVVIESPRHVESVTALSVAELGDILSAYAQRLGHWRDDGRFRYGLVFKNVGRYAGASLSHVHSQVVALPDLPPAVQRELDRAAEAFQLERVCPYCRWLDEERTNGLRIVLEREGYLAFCPFASLMPYEVWLLPLIHEPWFEQHGSMAKLADVLHKLLRRVEAVVPAAGYNLLLRTAPWDEAVAGRCHWRIEILPRTASIAGLELAAGMHINPLAPERAARQMRQNELFAGA